MLKRESKNDDCKFKRKIIGEKERYVVKDIDLFLIQREKE